MGKENNEIKLKNRNPIWDPIKKEGKYPFSIPPTELKRGSKILEGKNPDETKQDLTNKHGMDFAARVINLLREKEAQIGDKFVNSNLNKDKELKTPPD